ncbi:salmochelin biosynthesis C-glycosyltransferase IroB [Actinoallomurus acanthiterrae]
MRVLFCSHPGLGHFFPLVQLAWSFRTMGHEVVVTIADHANAAAAAGLEVVDVAPDYDVAALNERLVREHPDFFDTVATKPAINLEEWAPALAGVSRVMMDRIIALVDDWHPDLVVYDQGTTAGLFAAARARVPAVQRNMSAWRTRRMHEAIAEHLTDFAARYGISIGRPEVILESFPPGMLVGEEPEGWFMRWVPYGGGGVLGDRLPPRPDRLRVAVTMGTIELQTFAVDELDPIVTAAAGVDAEFVLALGDVDPGPLGPLPPNVRVMGWMPLNALLRTCAAVIHHGGGGTALTAVDAGIPQLVAPDPRDQFQYTTFNAVRKSGIGLVSAREDIDTALLTRLITDEQIRAATAEVRREMIALPTPADVTRRIIEHLG